MVANDEGRDVPQYKEIGASQHWDAVNRQLRSPSALGEGDLPLPKLVRTAILPSKLPESGECRFIQVRPFQSQDRFGR
jgi:hypothetical protein